MNNLNCNKKFNYQGVIPASKSDMNRVLICSTFKEQFIIHGDSLCEDVVKMKAAMAAINSGSKHQRPLVLDCGAAGTVLRFLAPRVARIPGCHLLRCTERLKTRPHEPLWEALRQLGVTVKEVSEGFEVEGEGWIKPSAPLVLDRSLSSQFISGIILNSWDLPFDLEINLTGECTSQGYLDMTLKTLHELGMNIIQGSKDSSTLFVPKNSQVAKSVYTVESDLSSAFAVAAFASLNGVARFQDYPFHSTQPDGIFLEILKKMGVTVELGEQGVTIKSPDVLNGIEVNLNSCPDLFPVLAVLCSFAKSPSVLYGAPQLVHKESNRIHKISQLFTLLQVEHLPTIEGIKIFSNPKCDGESFVFDPDQDHRIAFACSLAVSQGYNIQLTNKEVVNKSFPEFWDIIGL